MTSYNVSVQVTICMGPHDGAKRKRTIEASGDSPEGAKQSVRDMLTSAGHRDIEILDCQPVNNQP
jgi:hypothetical protein